MDEAEVLNESPQAAPQNETVETLSTKQDYRKKVWIYLEKNKLTKFPRPVYGRIPNFVGSEEAADRLAELDIFVKSENIEINPEKPQEAARILALLSKKNLYVPVPRLKEGLLKRVVLPEGVADEDVKVKHLVSIKGIEENGTLVGMNDALNIDMFVLGSVAVSRDGFRIGKGHGFADLEYAILAEMGAIRKDAVIVTIVHDSQVFETMPAELFQPYDVPVDYIVTPTQVIKVEAPLARPPGIFWKYISNRRIALMPILQALKDAHISQGKEVSLKDEDTDIESSAPRRFFRYRRFNPSRRSRDAGNERTSSESKNEGGSGDGATNQRYHRTRNFRRNAPPAPQENGDATADVNNTRRPKRSFRKNKPKIDFSLEVRNIEKTVRVSELKNALSEHGIKPNEITWRGYKGFCFLHYAKAMPKTGGTGNDEEQQNPILVDNVVEILKNLKINPESEMNLSVKVLEPSSISRIETTDVTAV